MAPKTIHRTGVLGSCLGCLPGFGASDARAFVFKLIDGEGGEWEDRWVNVLDGYSTALASHLPPPPLQDGWHPCALNRGSACSAFRAIEHEDVARVRKLFATSKDLLRWRQFEFTCGMVVSFTLHESVLHVAFAAALNLEILQHLFALSPLHFMQLMGMANTEQCYDEGANLPLLYAISLEFRDSGGVKCSRESQETRRVERLPAIVAWLCDTGLMTPTLAARCFPVVERPVAEKRVKQETTRVPTPWCMLRSGGRRTHERSRAPHTRLGHAENGFYHEKKGSGGGGRRI